MITLSPFEKYSRFGFFPWKFILHLLLVVLCTYQALKTVSIEEKHTRIQEQVFSMIYLQDDDGSTDYSYYSLVDFTDKFFAVTEQTNNLNESLLQYSDVSVVHYELDVYYSEMNSYKYPPTIYEGN